MSLRNDVISDVKNILDTKFDVEETYSVPDITNSKLTYGNTGLQFKGTVLYVDMRGSTSILAKHNRPVVAKIHMAYFHAILKVAQTLNGQVRSFNGDSVLVFFHGNSKIALNNAVRAAMEMRYMISSEDGINSYLSKYTIVDFGIGIDFGNILCTKIGLSKTPNNQDLIWIGHAVNKSTVVSDKCQSPYHVGISTIIYENLDDNLKYHKKVTPWGYEQTVDIWSRGTVMYNGSNEFYYYTDYHITVD